MEEILRKFYSIVENPYEELTQWKDRTKSKVIGCFPMHVPEEIIHAAGILPVTLLTRDKEITLASKYIQPYLCSLVCSKLDLALNGDLDFLDGIVFPSVCDLMEQVPDIWQLHKPILFHSSLGLVRGKLDLPSKRHCLANQFINLKARIEKSFGREVTDERLRQSIAIYNQNRNLLNHLYDIRRSNPALFHAWDLVTVVAASMLMPKEEHNHLLTNLITSVHRAPKVVNNKPRLILSNLCDQPKRGVLELIDQIGAVVADDDLYTGSRYFSTLVNETISPIEALVERYIHGVPCPTKSDVKDDWADYLINMVKKADANGVIILLVKFCEPHGFDYPNLKQKLSGAGIPNLLIETEAKGSFHFEQVRTRLQAFIEAL